MTIFGDAVGAAPILISISELDIAVSIVVCIEAGAVRIDLPDGELTSLS
jgi:hypothetical protein